MVESIMNRVVLVGGGIKNICNTECIFLWNDTISLNIRQAFYTRDVATPVENISVGYKSVSVALGNPIANHTTWDITRFLTLVPVDDKINLCDKFFIHLHKICWFWPDHTTLCQMIAWWLRWDCIERNNGCRIKPRIQGEAVFALMTMVMEGPPKSKI